MNITEDIHELVGRTPLIHLTHLGLPEGAQIYAKAELLNPGGSIKDRLGEHIIRKAEADGRLAKGGTILEITAGNTGIGLAFAALNRGYRLILIVPCCYSKEKQIVMRALGAEVVTVPAEDGLPGARKMAEKLQREISGSYFVDQFDNPDNPETYYETLGPEIYDQLDGKIDWFVTGAGSGGTFSGTAGAVCFVCTAFSAVSPPVFSGRAQPPNTKQQTTARHSNFQIRKIPSPPLSLTGR